MKTAIVVSFAIGSFLLSSEIFASRASLMCWQLAVLLKTDELKDELITVSLPARRLLGFQYLGARKVTGSNPRFYGNDLRLVTDEGEVWVRARDLNDQPLEMTSRREPVLNSQRLDVLNWARNAEKSRSRVSFSILYKDFRPSFLGTYYPDQISHPLLSSPDFSEVYITEVKPSIDGTTYILTVETRSELRGGDGRRFSRKFVRLDDIDPRAYR